MARAPAMTLFLMLLAGLAACGSSPERKIDYRAASAPPPLEVPPDLVKPAEDRSLTVPAPAGSATFSGYERLQQPKSTGGAVLPVPENIQVVRAGAQRWLLVRAEPEALWPAVREFFPRHGLPIAKENPVTGVIETDWAENRAKIPDDIIRRSISKIFDSFYSSGTRDKFRLRLERGTAAGTTEIYLSHQGLAEVVAEGRGNSKHWQPRPSEPELEAEMLSLLMTDLGMDADRAKSQLRQGAPKEGAKLEGDEQPVLKVYDQRDNAWRRVGLALDRGGWTMTQRERGRRYGVAAPPAQDGQANQTNKEPARYEILLTEEGAATTVQVRPLESADVQGRNRVLSLLYEQLK